MMTENLQSTISPVQNRFKRNNSRGSQCGISKQLKPVFKRNNAIKSDKAAEPNYDLEVVEINRSSVMTQQLQPLLNSIKS